MTPFLLLFSGGCHMMNNDDTLRDMVLTLSGVPLGAKSIIVKKNILKWIYFINFYFYASHESDKCLKFASFFPSPSPFPVFVRRRAISIVDRGLEMSNGPIRAPNYEHV